MKKFVFLDIDDVLLPWDFKNIKEVIDHSGFTDWKKVKHPHMNYVSFDLLNALWDSYQPDLYWLTTWELHMDGANALFCNRLGLDKLQEIPFIGDYYQMLGSSGWGGKASHSVWWKSSMVLRFLLGLEDDDFKILWIDNEIDDQIRNNNVDIELIDHPLIKTISPYPCLTKAQIEEGRLWLYG